jgi:imidazolonepropionase-like amidohydrolase
VSQYSPEEIRVVAEEAARRGSYVAAHAYSAAAIQVGARVTGASSRSFGKRDLDCPGRGVMLRP